MREEEAAYGVDVVNTVAGAIDLDQIREPPRAGAGQPLLAVPATPIVKEEVLRRRQQVAHGVGIEVFVAMAMQGAGAEAVSAGDSAEGENASEQLGLNSFAIGVYADRAVPHS